MSGWNNMNKGWGNLSQKIYGGEDPMSIKIREEKDKKYLKEMFKKASFFKKIKILIKKAIYYILHR